jgi:hypothetical protein
MIDSSNKSDLLMKRINRKRCVVCGKSPVRFAGYVYYESGTTRLHAPFCEEHLSKANEFANPIFENQAAADLFEQMHPSTYWQDVAGKPLIFFNSNKTATSN